MKSTTLNKSDANSKNPDSKNTKKVDVAKAESEYTEKLVRQIQGLNSEIEKL